MCNCGAAIYKILFWERRFTDIYSLTVMVTGGYWYLSNECTEQLGSKHLLFHI
ncbi:hypothetical protein GQ42DRAFT_165922, partial [Ramicandelaber brevisporus]